VWAGPASGALVNHPYRWFEARQEAHLVEVGPRFRVLGGRRRKELSLRCLSRERHPGARPLRERPRRRLGGFWIGRGDTTYLELSDAARRGPLHGIADPTTDEGGADEREDRNAVVFHVGIARERDRVSLDLARPEILELDGGVHPDDVGRNFIRIDYGGAVEFLP